MEYVALFVLLLILVCAIASFIMLFRTRGVSAAEAENLRREIVASQERTERILREELSKSREEAASQARQGREEAAGSFRGFTEQLLSRLNEITVHQKSQLESFGGQIQKLTIANEQKLEAVRETVERKLGQVQSDAQQQAAQSREETARTLKQFGDLVSGRMMEIASLQKTQLETFAESLNKLAASNDQKLEQMRLTLEGKLKEIQQDNSVKLEQMRATVDEKLHATLEQRLGESFRLVSDRLEAVHKGLGEMQKLASGVGDLKKVLTNIKTRGGWGEIQLGNLLEQLMTPEQYDASVCTNPNSSERVDFAIKLPGRDDDQGHPVWLPIDAKFPQEDYQRLLEAQDQGNPASAEEASRALEVRLRLEARKVQEKYVNPPHTTDFAILFLPTEGLFAEILRRPGLCESLQREFRVMIMGPTTLGAMLNSLQMGFRTLAIQKRSSEVWAVLGAVKAEFGKFGGVLEKVKKKLQEASNTVDKASTRSRVLENKLRKVQELPSGEPTRLLEAAEK
jgi:DNA recombination protein RmuC